jgi:hypothetical protein
MPVVRAPAAHAAVQSSSGRAATAVRCLPACPARRATHRPAARAAVAAPCACRVARKRVSGNTLGSLNGQRMHASRVVETGQQTRGRAIVAQRRA